MKKYQNSKKQGDAGLGSAIGWFSLNGYTVSIPLTDSQDYDLVVEYNGLNKVQVKTTTRKSKYGSFEVQLRTLGGNRSGNRVKKFDEIYVDFLFVLTSEDTKYLIPKSEITCVNTLTLNKNFDKFIIK